MCNNKLAKVCRIYYLFVNKTKKKD